MRLSRREFLKYSTIAAAAGLASRYFKIALPSPAPTPKGISQLKMVRSTCSPNDTGACGMNAMVSDGRIVSLAQAADYPEPEYNPRGCLKGLSFLKLIYGPDRLKRPLIRVGERGEGKFRVATWDEALDYLADKLLRVMRQHGPDSIAVSVQVPGTGYVHKGAMIRLASMFGWSALHGYSMNGDLPAFWPMTFGVQSEELESLEWANSRYIVVFGSNILVTRVPDGKFLNVARERGAKLVVIDPNYSPTASKADEWIPINLSTDAALAMGIAGVMINRRLYDETFVKSYTDLPLLVRTDNSKRLRARELKVLKAEAEKQESKVPEYRDLFVVYDTNLRRFVIPDPERLDGDTAPALEGQFEVELASGETVEVKPAFQLLKELVNRQYTPRQVARTVAPEEETARARGTWDLKLAREIAQQASLRASQLILEKGGPLVEGITVDELMKGPVRLNIPTPNRRQIPFWEQIHEGKPFPPISYPAPLAKTARFVKSGRMEFYKDEDVFIDLGEVLPVHKDIFVGTEYRSPGSEERYRFAYITRNSLYRVHSTHSNNITMLELQDFKPRIHMSPEVGREKGIKEGDTVKAYNDRGAVYGYAAFESGLHPQVIIFDQGWWSRYLRGSSYNALTYPWVKPTHIIYFVPGMWEPSTAWNEVACDVTKV